MGTAFGCAVFVPIGKSIRTPLLHREADVLTPLLLLGRRRGEKNPKLHVAVSLLYFPAKGTKMICRHVVSIPDF